MPDYLAQLNKRATNHNPQPKQQQHHCSLRSPELRPTCLTQCLRAVSAVLLCASYLLASLA